MVSVWLSEFIPTLLSLEYIFQETHRKLIDVSHNDVKEVQVSELIKVSLFQPSPCVSSATCLYFDVHVLLVTWAVLHDMGC